MARTHSTAMVPSDCRGGSFWHRLNGPERAAFTDVGRPRGFRRGTTILRAEDTARWTAIVISGRVRVNNGDGSLVVATRSAGDLIGEQRFLGVRPHQATVHAETGMRALVVDGADLDRLLARQPGVLRALCEVLSERLRECDRRLAGSSGDAFTKIVRFLAQATDATGDEPANTTHIGSQEALAGQLGISRDSVIRAFRRLRDDKVVTTHRGVVTVRVPARLREYP